MTKDGKTSVTLGCANPTDCDAGEKSCVETEKQVRTTCEAKCCETDNCNTAPEKGKLNLNQESKIEIVTPLTEYDAFLLK